MIIVWAILTLISAFLADDCRREVLANPAEKNLRSTAVSAWIVCAVSAVAMLASV